MAGGDQDRRTPVEWVGFEVPPEPPPDDLTTRTGRPGRWYVAGAAAVVALLGLVAVVHAQRGANHPEAAPVSGTSTSAGQPSSPVPFPPASDPATVTVPVVADRGHALLSVPAGWQLFGQGASGVVRVQLAQGVVTTTAVPTHDNASGAQSFVVGPTSALVRPYNGLEGYLVPDGQPAQAAGTGPLDVGGAIPGPDSTHFWTISSAGTQATLVDFAGHNAGLVMPVPADAEVVSDGSGYLMFSATSGEYDLRPSGVSRITTGQVLAAGPTGWLISECDAQYRCATYDVAQRTGVRRAITGVRADAIYGGSGVVSPDGDTAAVLETGTGGPPSMHLIDLVSGRDRDTNLGLDETDVSVFPTAVWSPDSRWLFVAAQPQRLVAYDVSTGQVSDLGVDAHISQVALRVG